MLIENFRPGLLKRTGLDYESVARFAPQIIYCSLKGYLPGPYENRLALDEVVQMMGGLAYMTGLPDRPMRAGASVNDIMGGMFGVIAIQAALAERQRTGRGRHIQSALYENNVFLMAQAMMYETVTGQPSVPYSVKDSPWPVYDLFDTSDGSKLFVTIVGEEQWQAFCGAFDRAGWLTDPRFATGQDRVDQRGWLIPGDRQDLQAVDQGRSLRRARKARFALRAREQARRSLWRSASQRVRRARRYSSHRRSQRQDAIAAGLHGWSAAAEPARSAADRSSTRAMS